ncbi:hypothetical protein [Mycolicibacterium parafortuitum]|uniref:Uncharacterized protein n=1 Tax=Mycolicibacterium parafortuitum TaxID=39692 RepID=A0A375YG79_MYCPF|nr:hypothetical protein [Mycolicibacterium parafortuitum]ORB28814.1 hypothetical protein BST38_17735 [Mycolicibacterium parafortuitum]PQE01748.1 hypothetical protein CYL16_06775 [Mycobacterium sp. EPG1]SRX80084.1 hypothetical protein MPP7335_01823 [Mycolicibacterium parafortuitum]
MTVIVKLPDGRVDEYLRFGDAYVKHDDGALDVVRVGARAAHSYAAGEWAEVDGDEKRWQKRRFRR